MTVIAIGTRDHILEKLRREEDTLARLKGIARDRMPNNEWRALEYRIRLQGALCQRLQNELSRMKLPRTPLGGYFMSAARRLLPAEQYRAIRDEAIMMAELEELKNRP